MRIRTIKPEFWKHPIFSREGSDVRLGAIGLLSLADDEGYFICTPALVRSELWPCDEDSVRAHGVLKRLSELTYFKLANHPTHGPIGFLVNFKKHQRINRPSPSRLKAYFITDNSLNNHVQITDDSSPEQGSRDQGIREQGTGGAAVNPAAAPPSPDPEQAEITNGIDDSPERPIHIAISAFCRWRGKDDDGTAANRETINQALKLTGRKALLALAEAAMHKKGSQIYPESLMEAAIAFKKLQDAKADKWKREAPNRESQRRVVAMMKLHPAGHCSTLLREAGSRGIANDADLVEASFVNATLADSLEKLLKGTP